MAGWLVVSVGAAGTRFIIVKPNAGTFIPFSGENIDVVPVFVVGTLKKTHTDTIDQL